MKIIAWKIMTRSELITGFIKKWEGGFSNHPLDGGGATNSGITLTTYRRYYGKDKTVDDLKNMTAKEWEYIFKKGYYYPLKAHLIQDDYVALALCDMGWMSGNKTAIKNVQRCLGLKDDGIIGPLTLSALNENPDEVFNQIIRMRKGFYFTIVDNNPSQIVFLKGWLNRLDSLVSLKQKG